MEAFKLDAECIPAPLLHGCRVGVVVVECIRQKHNLLRTREVLGSVGHRAGDIASCVQQKLGGVMDRVAS